jgi:hypothetical protein
MPGEAGEPRVERIHCNACGQDTKHEVIAERQQNGSAPVDMASSYMEEEISVSWTTIYTLFECRGCEAVTLRRIYVFSEWNPGEEQIEYFPPHLFRKIPDWADRLPNDDQSVLKEVYAALAADSRRLALMGERTLVDMFIVRKVGDHGTFADKLKKLETAGFLSSKNREVLEAALDAGHAASHRAYLPKREQLSTVMDIVENLLQSDLLAADVVELRKATPRRGSRVSATGPKKKP